MKIFKSLILIGFVSFALYSFNSLDIQEKWNIPEKYKKMENPTEPKANLDRGKDLYAKHCKACHGKFGKGDGPKADDLEKELGDFTNADFQAQSDGVIFYKSYIGRSNRHNFERKIPNTKDMWMILNYMRTLDDA